MSAETFQHLNTQTLIGYTSKRGTAWHYRASHQGSESNHYETAVPVADVLRRLFHWTPEEGPVQTTIGDRTYTDSTRKAIVRPDTGRVLGCFKSAYQVHRYDEWLIDNVSQIMDTSELRVGSAGLLRGGAVAWVQFEVADTLDVSGVEYRPFLTAATSMDGSVATTYQTGAQVVVCDNTLAAAVNEQDAARVKVRHSSRSLNRIAEVRDTLGLVYETADAFAAEVAMLTDQVVTDRQWAKFLDEYTGRGDEFASKNKKTSSARVADELDAMWRSDPRVAPWAGTAWGVVAATNTHLHHMSTIRGADRVTRNTERMILDMGRIEAEKTHALRKLAVATA